MVISGMEMQEALNTIKLMPDCKISTNGNILFIHRTLPQGEVYFLSNQEDKAVAFNAAFRVSGYVPQLWNPVDGSIRDLPQFTETSQAITVPLSLAAAESAFIVFGKKQSTSINKSMVNYPEPVKSIPVTTPWSVSFDNNLRGPAKPVVFNELSDWSKNSNDSIRYYSGPAVYTNKLKLPKVKDGEHVYLDLGAVTAIAKVTVNGVDVGGAWTPPYRVDITKAIKSGENVLNVKVVNTWVNRLIGDTKLPANERKTWLSNSPYNPSSGPVPAGLMGPVIVTVIRY
jgi:hypothetical protein